MRQMCKSKIHRATVTDAQLHYEGSVTIDFDLSIWQMLGAMVVGGRCAMLSDEMANQPSALLRAIEAEGATVVELVPSILRAVCASAARRGERRPGFKALRWLVSTGEALQPSLCEQWFALYPKVPLVNAYGPTECSDDVALHVLRAALPPNETRVPIGRPIANVEVLVLNDQLDQVPDGQVGELFVGGAGVGRGYVKDHARTALAFVVDPRTGKRLYRTGDLGRKRSDGVLEYLGRVDHQVKIRGLRIELGEVEAALASHPDVKEADVIAVPVTDGDQYLAAYVTLNRAVSAEELLQYAGLHLPAYMVPQVVIRLERLPTTAAGKVDRKALPSPDDDVGERRVDDVVDGETSESRLPPSYERANSASSS